MACCEPTLAQLTQRGVAVFQNGAECLFLAHRGLPLQSLLDAIGPERLRELAAQLPMHTLIAPVSREQERNLYHSEAMRQPAWNIQHIFAWTGSPLDLQGLNTAMALVVRNHDILRTGYMPLGDSWAQVIAPEVRLAFAPLDVTGLPAFKNFILEQQQHLFDVSAPPLLRAWTCHIDDTSYLGFVAHHSIADAFTPAMLSAELMGYYQSLIKGQTPEVKSIGEQYWQYALTQFDAEIYRGEETLRYWQGQLTAVGDRADIRMRLPFTAASAVIGDAQLQMAGGDMLTLPVPLCEALQRFNRDYEFTHTHLFSAAIAILLIHALDNRRAVVQLINNQRDRAALFNTLGEFTNILFLPFGVREIDPEAAVMDVLQKVKHSILDGLRHAKVDFRELLALTGLGSYENYYRQTGDVVINSTDVDAGTLDCAGGGRSLFADTLSAETASAVQGRALATLFYQIVKIDHRIHLITSYRKHLFDPSQMHQLSALIVRLVEQMIAYPRQKLKDMLRGLQEPLAQLKKQTDYHRLTADDARRKPLSEGQKGLWLLQQLAPGMTAYNLPIALKIDDSIRVDVLRQACAWMLQKHPILQTAFTTDEAGAPVQYVQKGRPLAFHHEAVPALSDAALQQKLTSAFKQPFRLAHDPLLRVYLFSRSAREHILLIIAHHIILDGTSILILVEDLLSAYASLCQERQPAAPSAATPVYYDFVDWEQALLSSAKAQTLLDYWREQLAGELPRLALPLDKKRPMRLSYAGATCTAELPAALAAQLRHLAAEQGVSLFVLLLAIYKVLLYKYTRQAGIIVGLPTIGRPEKRFQNALGFFINMVPLRSAVPVDEPFCAYLEKLRRTVANALDHAQYPFPKLVSELGLTSGASHAPVFQTLFVLQNPSAMQAPKARATRIADFSAPISSLGGLHQEGDHDLSLEVIAGAEALDLHLSYHSDLFFEATMAGLLDHYIELAGSIVRNPAQAVGRCALLSPESEQLLLAQQKVRRTAFAQDKLIHQVFERQARKTPQAKALYFKQHAMTYQKLNAVSRQIAKSLQRQGIGPGRLVGVCMERSLEMIVAAMAILKAGGVLLPIDPDFPTARIRCILADSRAPLLITGKPLQKKMQQVLPADGCRLYVIGPEWQSGKQVKGRLAETVRTGDPAYCIYTSGSTGEPKGVLVSHAALLDHCHAIARAYALTPQDHILQFAPLSVDTALEQILPGLMTGAAVVLKDAQVWPLNRFREKIRDHKITVVDLPPAYLHELLLDGTGFACGDPPVYPRLVISGGEALSPETVRLWQQSPMRRIRLINAYGPTEATITSTLYALPHTPVADACAGIPIGQPLDNVGAYILDESGRLCPPGLPGELHIGGAGVAIGYLNRPELTRERFIPDPFNPGGRMYKTGDLARRHADGHIEFLGRIDQQVKIRGYRVECAEIESVLQAQSGIANAVVVAKAAAAETNPGAHAAQLIACLVPAEPARTIDIARLRSALRAQLPDFMLPSAFLVVDQMPLTPAGKIDRQALARREIEATADQVFAPPRSATEKALCEIWQKVLQRQPIGIDDNFFELGGHSLLAVRLMAEIHKKLGVELPLATLFEAPTIAAQQAVMKLNHRKATEPRAPLVPIQPHGDKAPLFCVHPAGGDVLAYSALAEQFPKDYPLYGLQTPGPNGAGHPGSIEGLASLYIQAIRTVQSRGPYRLGGWSMGGLVAYEMARQFEAAGEQVAFVALFDSYTPRAAHVVEALSIQESHLDRYPPGSLRALQFAYEMGLDLRSMPPSGLDASGDTQAVLAEILEWAKTSRQPAADMDPEQFFSRFKIFSANITAMNAYQPAPIKCRVVLFCAHGDSAKITGQDPSRGWRELPIHLEIVGISGTHATMLAKPNVALVQTELSKLLRGCRP